eukprot:12289179-Heterocapsa_arctica.AAC.1
MLKGTVYGDIADMGTPNRRRGQKYVNNCSNDKHEDTCMELDRLEVAGRRASKAKGYVSLGSGAGDIAAKYIHCNIWAQRLSGKRPGQNPKIKCSNTKDGGVVHGG